MIDKFKSGDTKHHRFIVKEKHYPEFEGNVVHQLCSTYWMAKEIEWSTRKFVEEMLEADEEGFGTMVHIEHISPAFLGDEIHIEAKYGSWVKGELICSFVAKVGSREIAVGKTGQKILKKSQIQTIFSKLRKPQ